MAEPLSWLKLGGPRARTPTAPLPANSVESKVARDSRSGSVRPSSLSHMSSYTASLETRPKPLATEEEGDDDAATDLFVRSQDKVWYNPSLDQMVETLQVLLMTRGVLEPIPIEYNSYVLHLVDGFAKARQNIRKAEAACQEARQSLEHNLGEFRLLADDWIERESQYRAEVKRLEVLLSKSSPGGLEAVTLARANSIVDRSGSQDGGLVSRLNKFRRHPTSDLASPSTPFLTTAQVPRTDTQSTPARDEGSTGEIAPTPRILDNNNDFRMSEKIRRQDAVIKASITSRDKRAHRRGEILRPEQNGPRNWHDRFRNPFTDTLAASGMTGGRHDTSKGASLTTRKCTRDDIPVGLLSPKTSHCQVVTSGIRDVSASDIPVQTDETATMKVAPQHDQGNPGTSLEPMIYPDPLLDNPTDRRGNLRQPYDEQTPSHPAYRNCEGEKCQRYAGNTDSMSNKKGTELTENNSPVTHRALDDSSMVSGMIVRACRDSDRERQATITSSPSQSIHGRNSPTTISTTTQESPQIGKARANARVAATLALANVQGSTSQKI